MSGVVEEPFKFAVQAKDERAYEQQTIAMEAAEDVPITGTMKLTFGGKTTADIDVDTATADTVRNLLQALPTIGAVDVQKDDLQTNSGKKRSVWTVQFKSSLSHPANVGDLPLIEVDTSQLGGSNQKLGAHVLETMPGSSGNNRTDGDDAYDKSGAATNGVQARFQTEYVDVGVKEVQEIFCDADSGTIEWMLGTQPCGTALSNSHICTAEAS